MGISDDDKIERRSTTAAYSQGEAHHAKLADEVRLAVVPAGGGQWLTPAT
jgi:hypothetical protein